jgi:hypothetical protein
MYFTRITLSLLLVLFLRSSTTALKEELPELHLESAAKLIDVLGRPDSGEDVLEGSGVFYRSDLGEFFAVCDNIWREVLEVDESLTDENSEYITIDDQVTEIETYEGITYHYNSGTYYMVTEDVRIGLQKYQGRVLSFDDQFNLLSQNYVDYTFRDSNKGLEG